MKDFENENTSLFDELYTGLNQALEFAQGTGEAKITFYGEENYQIPQFEIAQYTK